MTYRTQDQIRQRLGRAYTDRDDIPTPHDLLLDEQDAAASKPAPVRRDGWQIATCPEDEQR